MPDGFAAEDAAPLRCAGVTTFNALRHCGATPGDLVAIQAIGGLGHLALRFANKFGYRTVAIGRGTDAKDLAAKLKDKSSYSGVRQTAIRSTQSGPSRSHQSRAQGRD